MNISIRGTPSCVVIIIQELLAFIMARFVDMHCTGTATVVDRRQSIRFPERRSTTYVFQSWVLAGKFIELCPGQMGRRAKAYLLVAWPWHEGYQGQWWLKKVITVLSCYVFYRALSMSLLNPTFLPLVVCVCSCLSLCLCLCVCLSVLASCQLYFVVDRVGAFF